MIKKSKTNLKKEYKLVFDKYYRPLCMYGLKFIQPIDIVEDIVQDVFLQYWNHQENVNYTKTYLFRAVKNKCLNYIRSEKKNEMYVDISLVEEELSYEVDDDSYLSDRIEILRKLIDELAPAMQNVFKCIAVNGMSYKETAEQLEISLNTVKTHLGSARKKVYHRLKAHHFNTLLGVILFLN